MKAIAVHPGEPNSIHLREIPEPQVTDIPDGRGVKVQALRVGVDGTDKEINAAEYGAAARVVDLRQDRPAGLHDRRRVLRAGDQPPARLPDRVLRRGPPVRLPA